MKAYTLAIAVLLSSCLLAQAQLFVDPAGTDSGDCLDSGAPCQTIDYAITQASDGDELRLTSGTYSSATISKRITLRGRGSSSIVQGLLINSAFSGTDFVTIRDLSVQSTSNIGVEIATSYVELDSVISSDHSSSNVSVNAAGSISNLVITRCILNGGSNGILIEETTTLDGLTVLNTTMNDNRFGLYSQLGNSSSNTMLENVLIRNCTFNSNLQKGIYAEKLSSALFENISVINSGTDPTYGFNNGIDINLKWQAYSDITIRNSRIIGCGALGSNSPADPGDLSDPLNRRSTALCIKARTDAGSYNGDPASLTDVTLDGVIIDGLVTDLRFGEMGKTDNDGIDMSTVSVRHCHLANDDLGGLLNEENTNTLALSNNYWGGGAPGSSDINDFGTSAATTQTGELSNLIVDQNNNSYADFATALAAVSATDTIKNLPVGTISGTTIINKDVVLYAPGAGLLDSTNSLVTFENLTLSGGALTLGGDVEISNVLTLEDDVVLNDYSGSAGSVVVNAGGSISDGVAMAVDGATATVADGTFSEGSILIRRRITLAGANAGVAATGSRSAETIIEPATANDGIFVCADGVTIDGLQLGSANLLSGIVADRVTDLTVSNTIFNTDSVGIYINDAISGNVSIGQNVFNTGDFYTPGLANLTTGISLNSLKDGAIVSVSDNEINGGSYGILVFDCQSTTAMELTDNTVADAVQGLLISATNGDYEAPNEVNIDGYIMTSFSEPPGGITNVPQAGIYVYTNGTSTANDAQTVSINNATISGTGSTTSDYAGIVCGDFSSADPADFQSVTVTESSLTDNDNRGMYVRGPNASVVIQRATFTNNGSDPTGAGGNHGFHLVVRNDAEVTVVNSAFTNPGAQISDQFDGLSLQTGSSLTISDSFFDQNGNGSIATTSGINLSGNYLGATDQSSLASWINAGCDYTPYLGSPTDGDLGTVGFQGDFSSLYVTNSGSQTGADERIQEAHDLLTAAGTLTLNLDDFPETPIFSKNLTMQQLSTGADTVEVDEVTMNGAGVVLTIDGNLRIANAITLTNGNVDVVDGSYLILASSVPDPVESSGAFIEGALTTEPRNIGTGALSLFGVDIAAGPDDMGDISIVRNSGADAIIQDGPHNSIAVHWDITVDTEPGSGRDVNFTWRSDFDNGKDMTDIELFKNEGSGWQLAGAVEDVSASDPRTYPTVSTTSFSSWTMAESDAPLPVTLLYFKGHFADGKVVLSWATASERDADYFLIERKMEEGSFVPVGEVKAAGDSKDKLEYHYVDHDFLLADHAFYRLKNVDFDGAFEYFDPILISKNAAFSDVKIYPNPVQQELFIQNHLRIEEVVIMSMNGQEMMRSGSRPSLDMRQLDRGTYVVILKNGKEATSQLMIKE